MVFLIGSSTVCRNDNPSEKEMFSLFGDTGAFAKGFPGYVTRYPQQQLAQAVWEMCAAENGLFAAEAPPGVGKSFALLAPALLHARKEDKRILVLTGSIPLQEQLIKKDLPQLMNILDVYLPYTLLKGRSRYACRARVKELGTEGLLSFSGDRGNASSLILDWVRESELGDLEEISLPPSHPGIVKIAAKSRGCLGRRCPEWGQCFVQRALRRSLDSQVVVANYHLFFAYTLGAGKPFPVPFDILICDEAHHLMEAARSSIAKTFSLDEMNRLLAPGVITQLVKYAELEHLQAEDFREELGELRKSFEGLFERILWKCGKGRTLKKPLEELVNGSGHVQERMGRVSHMLRPLAERFSEEDSSDEASALLLWLEDLSLLARHGDWCCSVADYPEWAYWWDGRSLQSVPTDCAPWIRQVMEFSEGGCMIASSATLAVEGSFAYWQRQTGLIPRQTLVVDTPFNLKEQMEIWVVDMGLRVVDPSYDDLFARTAERLIEDNQGRTLLLVSSRRLLGVVRERLLRKSRSYQVLVQGDLPRSELLRLFREDLTSVLVGTVSFREGVDIPGEGLTQVIIDRIPFPHPKDPLVEAQNDALGKRAFTEQTLPWAIMLLKQAVGRLVRSHVDKGRVVILDGRVVQRREWHILEALPRVRVRHLKLSSEIKKGGK
ncbi:MAG TPA: ATP-dependent DNA helicase [Synergistaceae bacterium]|nr:ATP-dependent DNA helicase [Synergistaceae bacterium]HPJ25927.1 ATP-dependent DNA helicase [Synergistaceae bacterium]HPQ37422.1 ATP-dependent DNA helicase [Synergistaceae bacterium]